MARLFPVAFLSLLTAFPASAQTTADAENWRVRDVSFALEPALQPPGTTIGSHGRLGLGMFGLKSEQSRQRAVTVREIDAPRHRRAGVGFSLKF